MIQYLPHKNEWINIFELFDWPKVNPFILRQAQDERIYFYQALTEILGFVCLLNFT
jgi:hypothetical protein